MQFTVSFLIFLLAWLPAVFVSLPVVFLLLLTKWDGKSGPFGNYLYGRNGNAHTPANPTLFDSWFFLAIRNPVSNLGKFTLSRGPYERAWLVEKRWWRVGILYGWKNPDERLPGARRPFVFRPFFR